MKELSHKTLMKLNVSDLKKYESLKKIVSDAILAQNNLKELYKDSVETVDVQEKKGELVKKTIRAIAELDNFVLKMEHEYSKTPEQIAKEKKRKMEDKKRGIEKNKEMKKEAPYIKSRLATWAGEIHNACSKNDFEKIKSILREVQNLWALRQNKYWDLQEDFFKLLFKK